MSDVEQSFSGCTCVFWRGHGLLLKGASGSGKSDLALRIIHEGGKLVADDVVPLFARDGRLIAAHSRSPGLIELRGQGIFQLPWHPEAEITIVVHLLEADRQERLPEPCIAAMLGIEVPCHVIDGRAPSAVARLAALLDHPRVA
ncbi:MAG: hypothetical protein H6877_15255 [Rhodobiaceae bacterium]|nr:hypothetical protein [Rhodobiaceae bacterium]